MKIFPAIDIIGGRVVRLYKGDYGKVKNYETSPKEAAKSFYRSGADCLHVVDLDGAKSGVAQNAGAVKSIISSTRAFVEIGGGIRSEEQIKAYLSAGAGRVILGTAAVTDFGFLEYSAKKYAGKIAVGVDAKDGRVAINGWREVTDTDAAEFCKKLVSAGVENVIYTDISRDGTLSGTNLPAYARLVKIAGLKVTASGGISSIDELVALKNMGAYAAILGKALYENRLSLEDALGVCKE